MLFRSLVAILAAVLAVPVPLLMPLLVDEVLLHKPGALLAWLDRALPAAWHTPLGYILGALFCTVLLRVVSPALQVWQQPPRPPPRTRQRLGAPTRRVRR